jgi:outer membrane protein assembly factor BamB
MRTAWTGALIALSVAAAEANWPSFRGSHAAGSAPATLATAWNAVTGAGIRWRTPVPGLSHASPIVWNDRVYVVSAVAPGSSLDTRAEGVVFAKDTIEHEWRLHCLDAANGRELWMRILHTGVPRQPRHVKGTYANATPATNGSYIAAVLGNEGLFVADMNGGLLWRKEMAPGRPDWSLDAASSPVIVGDLVIVQNDWQREGFAAAFELSSGRERWRVPRAEGLSWSTPGVWPRPDGGFQVVFNSPRWIRAHDARDGRELWRLDNTTDGPSDRVPTPVPAGDLMLVAGGGGNRPVFAVRSSASGDITPHAAASSAAIAWVSDRASPYLPTPLVHRGLVYVCGSAGALSVYRASDGALVYRARVAPDAGTFSSSPIAAGGRIYLASEDGDVFVVAAGETFDLLSRNPMGAPIFATPAVASRLLIVRTADAVFGI